MMADCPLLMVHSLDAQSDVLLRHPVSSLCLELPGPGFDDLRNLM